MARFSVVAGAAEIGPQGPQGLQGIQGPTGPAGPITPLPDARTHTSIINYTRFPARVVSTSIAKESVVIDATDDTIVVEIGQQFGNDYTAVKTQTFTIPHVSDPGYSSMTTAFRIINDTDAVGTGFHFNAENGYLYVEIDPKIYPPAEGQVIKIVSGNALTNLGFTAGQTGTIESDEWRVIDAEALPTIKSIDSRLTYIEENGAAGGGLSATRPRTSGFVYLAGPVAGPMDASTAWTAETAYIQRMDGLAKDMVIANAALEFTSTPAGNSTWDIYIADSTAGGLPNIIQHKLGQYSVTTGTATGFTPLSTPTAYTVPEDGTYWLIARMVTGGTAPTLRRLINNTSQNLGSLSAGVSGFGGLPAAGYSVASFPADASLVLGTSKFNQSPIAAVSGSNNIPRMAFQLG